ncbi:MAG: glycosyltransferase family 4 protein [Marinifilaceae bacterium]|nr:glycosyltransferase family 4 protein [Marinifilaceae bacterium]
MMKTVWIVNYYTDIPERVSNPRHYEFAKYLTSKGYFVRVFFADRKRIPEEGAVISSGKKFLNEEYEGIQYTRIAAIPYVGNLKRGISIWKFAWRIFCIRRQFEIPDVILFNMHAPFDFPLVWCAKSLKARLITEAWDLWPDSFVRFGLMSEKNPVTKFFYWIEKKIYESGDRIVFSFEGGADYLKKRGWLKGYGGKIVPEKISYINNGVNLALFEENQRKFPTKDVDLLRDDIVKVVYLGSVRLVNHVRDLIEAAEILQNENNIKFIIIGDGPDRPVLEQYCRDRGLHNILFKQKHVPFCDVADIVSHASINVMNYQKDFGLYGVSSGKLFLYLAAGQPILCNIKLNYCEITRNAIGIAEDLDNPQKYADAILKLARLSVSEKCEMRERIKYVAQKFDYPYLSSCLEQVIESVC